MNEKLIEKHNFKIDLFNKTVSISVSPLIFPVHVILHAAYHFIDNTNVIVSGDREKITVTLISNVDNVKELDLEKLAYEFNVQLISSFVEEVEARKYADIRNTMVKTALGIPSIKPQKPQEKGEE